MQDHLSGIIILWQTCGGLRGEEIELALAISRYWMKGWSRSSARICFDYRYNSRFNASWNSSKNSLSWKDQQLAITIQSWHVWHRNVASNTNRNFQNRYNIRMADWRKFRKRITELQNQEMNVDIFSTEICFLRGNYPAGYRYRNLQLCDKTKNDSCKIGYIMDGILDPAQEEDIHREKGVLNWVYPWT